MQCVRSIRRMPISESDGIVCSHDPSVRFRFCLSSFSFVISLIIPLESVHESLKSSVLLLDLKKCSHVSVVIFGYRSHVFVNCTMDRDESSVFVLFSVITTQGTLKASARHRDLAFPRDARWGVAV